MKNVKIYTSTTCAYCHAAKEYLEEKGVSYEEKNISTDSDAKKELISMGYMGVPIIMVDDDVVEGFNKNKLDELL